MSCLAEQDLAQSAGPFNVVPSDVTPDASIRPDPVVSRQLPTPSKFSSAKPERVHDAVAGRAGGIGAVHFHALAHGHRLASPSFSASAGTFGGGGGGGVPRSFSSTHLPRIVGAVRLG